MYVAEEIGLTLTLWETLKSRSPYDCGKADLLKFNLRLIKDYEEYILTSTKNASLIITDFLAMIKENEP